MNDYEFGKLMYSRGNVAQIRNDILNSVKAGGGTCDSANGFISVMRDRENKSGVERVFLKAFDKAMRQPNPSLEKLETSGNATKLRITKKCCVCKTAQAVALWPCIDPDIQSYPYCRTCLDGAQKELFF